VRLNEPNLLNNLNPLFFTEGGVFPMASNPPIQAQTQSQTNPLNLTNTTATTAGALCLQSGIEADRSLPLRRECYPACALVLPEPRGRRQQATSLSASGRVQVDETVAAIRLRARHHDPYEEWARRTRRDALVCPLCLSRRSRLFDRFSTLHVAQ
jgi:hypothetical protein